MAGQPRLASFDTPGALLGTGGMLLLIYALVKAPDTGWGSDATIGELARAGALFAALIVNELRHLNPVLPLSIFRIKGLTATDASQVLGIAGFYAAFFLVTLYMQEILHFFALRAGSAYLPITVIIAVGSIGGSGIIPRIGPARSSWAGRSSRRAACTGCHAYHRMAITEPTSSRP